VLKDGDKRAAYDRFGHAAFEQGGGPGFGADFASSFADIFDDFFGMGAGRRSRGSGRERGADLRYNMELTLEEAFSGKAAQIHIPTSVTCEICAGNGAKAGTKPRVCAMCGGQGKIRHAQGFFTLEADLFGLSRPRTGDRHPLWDMWRPRPDHAGARALGNIPPGVEDGTRIRLSGEGEAGVRGGPAGDLYIFFQLRLIPFFSGMAPICTAGRRFP